MTVAPSNLLHFSRRSPGPKRPCFIDHAQSSIDLRRAYQGLNAYSGAASSSLYVRSPAPPVQLRVLLRKDDLSLHASSREIANH